MVDGVEADWLSLGHECRELEEMYNYRDSPAEPEVKVDIAKVVEHTITKLDQVLLLSNASNFHYLYILMNQ